MVGAHAAREAWGEISTTERSKVLNAMADAIEERAHRRGIQALRNFADVEDFTSVVYATPQFIFTLTTSTRSARMSGNQLFDVRRRGMDPNATG